MSAADTNNALALAVPFMAFAGGAMTLIGGLFTFVNGRLNEANTPERKGRVIDWVVRALAVIFYLIGGTLSFITFIWILPFYTIGIMLDITLFIRTRRPINRWDMVMLAILLSGYFTLALATFVFFTTDKIISQMGQHLDLIEKQQKMFESQNKNLDDLRGLEDRLRNDLTSFSDLMKSLPSRK
jgi:hypothetical protein